VSPDLLAAVDHILAAAIDPEPNRDRDPAFSRDPKGSAASAGGVAPSTAETFTPPTHEPGPVPAPPERAVMNECEPAPGERAAMDQPESEQRIKPRAPEHRPPEPRTPAPREPAEQPGHLGRAEPLLDQILEELRMTRREQQHEDFSIAKLAGAVAQAFALCAMGWGLYAWMNTGTNPSGGHTATVSLLTAIAFQVMALTFFAASSRR
jgi:hypothetical protein